jgi:hypothetical protein
MKKRVFYLTACAILATAIISSCSKKDDNTDNPSTGRSKPFLSDKTQLVATPAGLSSSSDPMASMCTGYIATVNALSAWNSAFTMPSNAQPVNSSRKSVTPGEYTWTYGDQTVWYKYEETTDMYKWTIYYSNTTVPKTKVLYAEETKTAGTGKMEVFDWETTGSIAGRWSWTKDASNNFDIVFEAFSGDAVKIHVVANADNSGNLEVWENSNIIYAATWNAAGHGSWTYYGESTLTGTF